MNRLVFFFAIKFFVILSFSQDTSRIVRLDGIVEFTFVTKDVSYVLNSVKYIEHNDNQISYELDLIWINSCGLYSYMDLSENEIRLLDSLKKNEYKKTNLNWAPQYRDTTIMTNNPYHYGGDIYNYNSDTQYPTLKIAFNFFGLGVVLENENVTEKINLATVSNCMEYYNDIVIKLSSPTIMLVIYENTSSLTNAQMEMLSLTLYVPASFDRIILEGHPSESYRKPFFPIVWCE